MRGVRPLARAFFDPSLEPPAAASLKIKAPLGLGVPPTQRLPVPLSRRLPFRTNAPSSFVLACVVQTEEAAKRGKLHMRTSVLNTTISPGIASDSRGIVSASESRLSPASVAQPISRTQGQSQKEKSAAFEPWRQGFGPRCIAVTALGVTEAPRPAAVSSSGMPVEPDQPHQGDRLRFHLLAFPPIRPAPPRGARLPALPLD
jgi:hypothetical protein